MKTAIIVIIVNQNIIIIIVVYLPHTHISVPISFESTKKITKWIVNTQCIDMMQIVLGCPANKKYYFLQRVITSGTLFGWLDFDYYKEALWSESIPLQLNIRLQVTKQT